MTYDLIDADELKSVLTVDSIYDGHLLTISTSSYEFTMPTFDDLVSSIKDQIKLQPMVCLNCGGSICRDSLTCEFCGTPYRL